MIFDRLIEHFGNQSEMANFLGVTRAAVTKWKETGIIPSKYAPMLSEETGIPAHEINSLFTGYKRAKK